MKILIFLSVVFCLIGAAGIAKAEKIDINTAPLEKLIKITHIGEVRAQELISLRPFSSLDDLTRIKGIGEARIKAIKEQGLAWVAEARPPQASSAEDGPPQTPQTMIELTEDSNNYPLLAAVFTSLSGGVMILVLKKKIKI